MKGKNPSGLFSSYLPTALTLSIVKLLGSLLYLEQKVSSVTFVKSALICPGTPRKPLIFICGLKIQGVQAKLTVIVLLSPGFKSI